MGGTQSQPQQTTSNESAHDREVRTGIRAGYSGSENFKYTQSGFPLATGGDYDCTHCNGSTELDKDMCVRAAEHWGMTPFAYPNHPAYYKGIRVQSWNTLPHGCLKRADTMHFYFNTKQTGLGCGHNSGYGCIIDDDPMNVSGGVGGM